MAVVLVAGGTGFVGRHVVRFLKNQGHHVLVYSTNMKTVPTYAEVIVNCIGAIREDKYTFKETHVDITEWLVRLGKKLKIQQFVQVSAIGADLDGTRYQRTKAQAELLVQSSGLPYAIVRPSLIFGKKDKSVNLFRKIARTGFFPLFANGRVQPVHVDVVSQVVAAAVNKRIKNKIVEVGGPEIFTYEQLVKRIHPGVTIFQLPGFLIWLFTTIGSILSPLPTAEMVAMMWEDNLSNNRMLKRMKIRNIKLK